MTNGWSELFPELLSQIADRLGLIDLLGFRGVCKAWNSAASVASAEIESSGDAPWFLSYGETSQCTLLTNEGKRYTINISEMEGATCLASYVGWLLLFRQGDIFFFCPFTGARIDIPSFPQSELFDYVAAFSSPPTSEDCTVVMIRRSNDKNHLEVNIIRRGEQCWTRPTDALKHNKLNTVQAAAYHRGFFQFLDDATNLVTFSPEEKVLHPYVLVCPSKHGSGETLKYRTIRKPFLSQKFTKESELDIEYSCIDTCGTLTQYDELYFNERVSAGREDTPPVQGKGVWIQPRFHQIPKGQSWALRRELTCQPAAF